MKFRKIEISLAVGLLCALVWCALEPGFLMSRGTTMQKRSAPPSVKMLRRVCAKLWWMVMVLMLR